MYAENLKYVGPGESFCDICKKSVHLVHTQQSEYTLLWRLMLSSAMPNLTPAPLVYVAFLSATASASYTGSKRNLQRQQMPRRLCLAPP